MSSTNRGYARHKSDFYITPQEPIELFFRAFMKELDSNYIYFNPGGRILDPCAGGNSKYEMPYPAVLSELGFKNVFTCDIRPDSRAKLIQDYLGIPNHISEQSYFDLIITNPPFNLALDFIKKGLLNVKPHGYVIMLLRLNFFGSQKRQEFFKQFMPKYCFIHSERISFFPEDIELGGKIYKKGSTDSIEYAHFVFQKSYSGNFTKTFVI
jgi:hypothetical protein